MHGSIPTTFSSNRLRRDEGPQPSPTFAATGLDLPDGPKLALVSRPIIFRTTRLALRFPEADPFMADRVSDRAEMVERRAEVDRYQLVDGYRETVVYTGIVSSHCKPLGMNGCAMIFRCLSGWLSIQALWCAGLVSAADPSAVPVRLAAFQVDATPPLGSPLCNGLVKPVSEVVTPLTARGIVLLGAGAPIVQCALDWVAVANESSDAFRQRLAEATGTSIDRVTVHTLHQHDAPGSDLATERLLAGYGLAGKYSNPDFDREVMARVSEAARSSLGHAKPITHVGFGAAEVERVASNRRILGEDGKVAIQRQSSSRNPKAQAAPEGTIDPQVRLISFWNQAEPVAVLTYYATHPQSYYGQGSVNWDFVGIARQLRSQALPEVAHLHFNGAGGNVAAGKYNDGSRENRLILAQRLATGMKAAWDTQRQEPLHAGDIQWRTYDVHLPVRETLVEPQLLSKLEDPQRSTAERIRAARDLTFLRRSLDHRPVTLFCWGIGATRVLYMPGELFVEYQLAAQRMRPDSMVAMAAYGDSGPGYIGTEIAYSQGGYETGIVSRVGPTVEPVLMKAIQRLLVED
jgi:hypothetical protein